MEQPKSSNLDRLHLNRDLTEYAMSFVNKAGDLAVLDAQAARIYGFSVGGVQFLLPMGTKAEVIAEPNFTPLPNAPEHCLGLANVRGTIAPFYQLQSLLSLAAKPKRVKFGLLIGELSQAVMLAIDDKPVSATMSVFRQSSQTLENTELNHCVTQCYQKEESLWFLLDTAALFQLLGSRLEI